LHMQAIPQASGLDMHDRTRDGEKLPRRPDIDASQASLYPGLGSSHARGLFRKIGCNLGVKHGLKAPCVAFYLV
jgi:hypothetical protein